ncbi:MAG: CheR family methyltransferase [Anaerolineales bacterium]
MTMMTSLAKPSLTEADYVRFSELVRQASGLEVPETRRFDLAQAIAQALTETAAPDTHTLYQFLNKERGRPALETLIEALTIGETHFFRNRPQFEALTKHILPDLIERRRDVRRLRLWSAGCASGEEAYSLAILIECLIPDLDQWNVHILATDINRQALAKARRGVYSPWSFREVPPDIHEAFFIHREREFEIAPHLRDCVTFAHLNLVEDVYPSLLTNTQAMDLILFRNVLIYFREATTRQIVGRLHTALAEGGWLVVGHADASQSVFHQFAVRNFPGTVVYQKQPLTTEAALPSARLPELRPITLPRQALPPKRNAVALTTKPRPAPKPAASSASAPPTPLAASTPYHDALALWDRGQLDQALRQLEALAAAHPREAQASYLAAKIQANRQQFEAAERHIQTSLQRNPLFAPAHYLHGLILQETGRLDAAVEALRRCIYTDAQFVLGHFALAGLLARLGQAGRTQKALDNVIDLLANRRRDELLPEGDGLTVGHLLELAAIQKELND